MLLIILFIRYKQRLTQQEGSNKNTGDGEGSTLIELPVQLEERHLCISEQTNDNVNDNANLPNSERLLGTVSYENVSQSTANDQKALEENKGKYTDSEGYETPVCCSHVSPKAEQWGGNVQYENTPQVATNHEEALKEVAEKNQNRSKEGVYEIPTPGAKDDEMEKHVYSVLLQ